MQHPQASQSMPAARTTTFAAPETPRHRLPCTLESKGAPHHTVRCPARVAHHSGQRAVNASPTLVLAAVPLATGTECQDAMHSSQVGEYLDGWMITGSSIHVISSARARHGSHHLLLQLLHLRATEHKTQEQTHNKTRLAKQHRAKQTEEQQTTKRENSAQQKHSEGQTMQQRTQEQRTTKTEHKTQEQRNTVKAMQQFRATEGNSLDLTGRNTRTSTATRRAQQEHHPNMTQKSAKRHRAKR